MNDEPMTGDYLATHDEFLATNSELMKADLDRLTEINAKERALADSLFAALSLAAPHVTSVADATEVKAALARYQKAREVPA